MDEVFPKMAKCQFNRHGPGGGIQVGIQLQATAIDNHQAFVSPCCVSQNHDALCLLPLNIVNEKIYLCMWVWLIFLAAASGLAVIYRSEVIKIIDYYL